MSFKKKLLAILATLAMSAGIVAVVATPAQAALSRCPAGTACIFIDSYGNGTMQVFSWSQWGDWKCLDLAAGYIPTYWDNAISSMTSDYGSGHALQVSYGHSCQSGDFPPLYKGDQWPYLYWPDNDSFSSLRII